MAVQLRPRCSKMPCCAIKERSGVMANKNPQTENLIPLNQRSEEEAREIRAKGGAASAATRRRKRLLRDCANDYFDSIIKNAKGEEKLGSEAMMAVLFKKALAGDIK